MFLYKQGSNNVVCEKMENMNNQTGCFSQPCEQNNEQDLYVTTPIVRNNTSLPQYDKISREYADIVKTLALVQMNLDGKFKPANFLKYAALDRHQ